MVDSDEVDLQQINGSRHPDRWFIGRGSKIMKFDEPAFDGAMPLDRNADVEILRHDERGGRVGLEEIGDLGAHDQHAWLFEHCPCPSDRRQQSGSELHAPSIGSAGGRIYRLVCSPRVATQQQREGDDHVTGVRHVSPTHRMA
jgi:hypothetical protein